VGPHFNFSIYLFILVFEYFSELRWLLYLAFRDLIGKEMHLRCKFHKSDGIGPSNGSELGKSSRRKKSFFNFFFNVQLPLGKTFIFSILTITLDCRLEYLDLI